MNTTFSTSMTCGGCLSKVTPFLDNEPSVRQWKPDLSDPRKLIHVELAPDGRPEHIVNLIGQAGFTASVIPHEPETISIAAPAAKPAFSLATYKPLFLVVSYVIGATVLVESIHANWQWTRAMSYFMGFFFLGFAFFKLLNISKFADAFSTYDIIARRSRPYALAYPWIEVTLGLLFVTGTQLMVANVVTAVVMSIGLVGVIAAVRKKQAIQCACLGTAFNLPMSVVTIIENSVMIAMALAMLAM